MNGAELLGQWIKQDVDGRLLPEIEDDTHHVVAEAIRRERGEINKRKYAIKAQLRALTSEDAEAAKEVETLREQNHALVSTLQHRWHQPTEDMGTRRETCFGDIFVAPLHGKTRQVVIMLTPSDIQDERSRITGHVGTELRNAVRMAEVIEASVRRLNMAATTTAPEPEVDKADPVPEASETDTPPSVPLRVVKTLHECDGNQFRFHGTLPSPAKSATVTFKVHSLASADADDVLKVMDDGNGGLVGMPLAYMGKIECVPTVKVFGKYEFVLKKAPAKGSRIVVEYDVYPEETCEANVTTPCLEPQHIRVQKHECNGQQKHFSGALGQTAVSGTVMFEVCLPEPPDPACEIRIWDDGFGVLVGPALAGHGDIEGVRGKTAVGFYSFKFLKAPPEGSIIFVEYDVYEEEKSDEDRG